MPENPNLTEETNSDLVTGLAVPLCVGAVWYAMRRLRRSLEHS